MPLKTWNIALPLAALLAMAVLPARAADNGVWITTTNGEANCVNVQTIGKNRNIVDCPSGQAYNFCFTRETTDLSGLLNGTLHYFSDPSYADQSKIAWDSDQGVYYGITKYVTPQGDLTLKEVGIHDSKNKNYAGIGTVTEGTGRFANATGSMSSRGNGNTGGTSSGTICLK